MSTCQCKMVGSTGWEPGLWIQNNWQLSTAGRQVCCCITRECQRGGQLGGGGGKTSRGEPPRKTVSEHPHLGTFCPPPPSRETFVSRDSIILLTEGPVADLAVRRSRGAASDWHLEHHQHLAYRLWEPSFCDRQRPVHKRQWLNSPSAKRFCRASSLLSAISIALQACSSK